MDEKEKQLETIKRYFPELSPLQEDRLQELWTLYNEWNEKINVISRKDIGNLYLHHVLHSMSIARYIKFSPGSHILDLGTGGGFPGIPLAILMEDVQWTLIDGTKKKITVTRDIAEKLSLDHVTALQVRAEEVKDRFDFVVTRAVADLDVLLQWSRRLITAKHKNSLPNGLIALKGGAIKDEVKKLSKSEYYEVIPIARYFAESYFEEKYIVYVQG